MQQVAMITTEYGFECALDALLLVDWADSTTDNVWK
jgi:hypothetical protein